jgi:hypothetical protein
MISSGHIGNTVLNLYIPMPANHDPLSLERFFRGSRIEEPRCEQCRIQGNCFALHVGVVPPGIVGPNDVGTTKEICVTLFRIAQYCSVSPRLTSLS